MSDFSATETPAGKPRIDDCDWSRLTLGDRIRHLEVEGYVLIPNLLDAGHIRRLKAQTATFETTHVDYSVHKRGRSNVPFEGGGGNRVDRLSADDPVPQDIVRRGGHDVIRLRPVRTRAPRHQSALRWPAMGLPDLPGRVHLPKTGPGTLLP